jgi:hypothetical protein
LKLPSIWHHGCQFSGRNCTVRPDRNTWKVGVTRFGLLDSPAVKNPTGEPSLPMPEALTCRITPWNVPNGAVAARAGQVDLLGPVEPLAGHGIVAFSSASARALPSGAFEMARNRAGEVVSPHER